MDGSADGYVKGTEGQAEPHVGGGGAGFTDMHQQQHADALDGCCADDAHLHVLSSRTGRQPPLRGFIQCLQRSQPIGPSFHRGERAILTTTNTR